MPITTGSWVQIQASEAVANGAMSAGASTPVNTSTHAHLLGFRLSVSSGSAGKIHLYRRRGDGTNLSPTPTAGYKHPYR